MNKCYRVEDSGYSRKATIAAYVETRSRSILMLFDRYRVVSQANPDLFSLPEGYIECGNELYNLEIMLSRRLKGLHGRIKRLSGRVQRLYGWFKELSGRINGLSGRINGLSGRIN